MRYHCCDERRRETIRDNTASPVNGIDFLEVVDREEPNLAARQLLLRVHFVNPPKGGIETIGPANLRITGGVRVTGIKVIKAEFAGNVLEVWTDRRGDY